MKVIVRKDGEWFAVPRRGQPLGCCDCHLMHTINFKIVKGQLHMQAFRDDKFTARERRKFGVKVTARKPNENRSRTAA